MNQRLTSCGRGTRFARRAQPTGIPAASLVNRYSWKENRKTFCAENTFVSSFGAEAIELLMPQGPAYVPSEK